MRGFLTILITAVAMSGCASFDVGRYGVSVENNAALKKLGSSKVAVDQPFVDWMRKALVDELTVADLFMESAPVTLTGRVNQLDFDSMAGEWKLDLTVFSSNGQALTVANNYSYGFTYIGETACARTAKSFAPAVQLLIGKLVYDPKFADLLK